MPLYADERGRTKWTRVVYVIDLEPEACDATGSPCGGDCNRRPVYVGETALDPEERFEQHLAGVHASKWVLGFGARLNEALSQGLDEFETVAESQAAEAQLGDLLRSEGYCVFGAH